MSILLKNEILEQYNNRRILIVPFNQEYIGPNSYDVRLDNTLLVYDQKFMQECRKENRKIRYLNSRKENKIKKLVIDEKYGIILYPGILYLGNTIEAIGSDNYIPMYEGRSSMARLGIQSHISAGFGDIGFKSTWTLEITVVHPVKIYAGMRIGQIYFHKVDQENNTKDNRYNGKYLNQNGPQASLSFKDEK